MREREGGREGERESVSVLISLCLGGYAQCVFAPFLTCIRVLATRTFFFSFLNTPRDDFYGEIAGGLNSSADRAGVKLEMNKLIRSVYFFLSYFEPAERN